MEPENPRPEDPTKSQKTATKVESPKSESPYDLKTEVSMSLQADADRDLLPEVATKLSGSAGGAPRDASAQAKFAALFQGVESPAEIKNRLQSLPVADFQALGVSVRPLADGALGASMAFEFPHASQLRGDSGVKTDYTKSPDHAPLYRGERIKTITVTPPDQRNTDGALVIETATGPVVLSAAERLQFAMPPVFSFTDRAGNTVTILGNGDKTIEHTDGTKTTQFGPFDSEKRQYQREVSTAGSTSSVTYFQDGRRTLFFEPPLTDGSSSVTELPRGAAFEYEAKKLKSPPSVLKDMAECSEALQSATISGDLGGQLKQLRVLTELERQSLAAKDLLDKFAAVSPENLGMVRYARADQADGPVGVLFSIASLPSAERLDVLRVAARDLQDTADSGELSSEQWTLAVRGMAFSSRDSKSGVDKNGDAGLPAQFGELIESGINGPGREAAIKALFDMIKLGAKPSVRQLELAEPFVPMLLAGLQKSLSEYGSLNGVSKQIDELKVLSEAGNHAAGLIVAAVEGGRIAGGPIKEGSVSQERNEDEETFEASAMLDDDDDPKEKKAEKSPAELLKEKDAGFDELIKKLDKEIDKEKAEVDVMSEALRKARAESLGLRIKTGNLLAQEAEADEKHDKEKLDVYSKQLADLRKLDKDAEKHERRIFESLPAGIKARTMKSVVQISSGKDEHIEKGEAELCRLVKENPQLATNKQFRDLVILSYAEMAAARQLRGLGEWTPKTKVDDIVTGKNDGPKDKSDSDPIELLKKANEVFFQDDGGIEKATPLFEQAIAAQRALSLQGDKARIQLFISSLGQDAQIAQDAQAGKDVDARVKERIASRALEEKAADQADSAKGVDSSLRMNFAFARIASGKPALYDDAVKDLMACLGDNPAMSFEDGFQTNCRQAFKAHAQNRKAIDEAVAAGKNDEPKPVYNDLDLNKVVRNGGGKDKPIESYTADDLTGPALTALGLGLAIAQFMRTRSKMHSANIMKGSLSAASEVKPIEDLKTDVRAKRDTKAGEAASFEIKGTARDGRIVLLRDMTDVKPQETPPIDFKEIKPGKTFEPSKLQYLEYTPIEVNGKQYFADIDGRTYKYEHKPFGEPRLFEDAETRQIELVPRSEVKGLLPELKVIPDALSMTYEHPQKAMPTQWQKEFDFIRDVKRALAETDRPVTSRLEALDRAVKSLNDTAPGDRQKFAEELIRQMDRVGIKVEYSQAPATEGGKPEFKLYISEPGSDKRIVITAEKDKPASMELRDKEGKITTETGPVKVNDELTRLESLVTRNLKDPAVKDKLWSWDPELKTDASRKEVRRSFLDGLPTEWRVASEHAIAFERAILKAPDVRNLQNSLQSLVTQLGKESPHVMQRALAQIESELRARGIEAKVEFVPTEGGTKATLSMVAQNGKNKVILYTDGSKPAIEPSLTPGKVIQDDAAVEKALGEVATKARTADTTSAEPRPLEAESSRSATTSDSSDSSEASDRAKDVARSANAKKAAELMLDKAFMKSVIDSMNLTEYKKYKLHESYDLEPASKALETAFKDALAARLKEHGVELPEAIRRSEIDIRDSRGYTGRGGLRTVTVGDNVRLSFLEPPVKRGGNPVGITPLGITGDALVSGKTKATTTAMSCVTIDIPVPHKLMKSKTPEALEQIYEKYAELAVLEGRTPSTDVIELAKQVVEDKKALQEFSDSRKGAVPEGAKPAKLSKPSDSKIPTTAGPVDAPKEAKPFLDRVGADRQTVRPAGSDRVIGWAERINGEVKEYLDGLKSSKSGSEISKDADRVARYLEAVSLSKVTTVDRFDRPTLKPIKEWLGEIQTARDKMDRIEPLIASIRTSNGVEISVRQAAEILRMQELTKVSNPLEAFQIVKAESDFGIREGSWKLAYLAVQQGVDTTKPAAREQITKLLAELDGPKYSEYNRGTAAETLKYRLGLHQASEKLGIDVKAAEKVVDRALQIEKKLQASNDQYTLENKWRAAVDVAVVMQVEGTEPGNADHFKEAVRIAERLKILQATTSDIKVADAIRGVKPVSTFVEFVSKGNLKLDLQPKSGETSVQAVNRFVEQQIGAGKNVEIWKLFKAELDTNSDTARAFAETIVNLQNEVRALSELPKDFLVKADAETYSRIVNGVTAEHLKLMDPAKVGEFINKMVEPSFEKSRNVKPTELHAMTESSWRLMQQSLELAGANRDAHLSNMLKSLSTESLTSMMRAASYDRLNNTMLVEEAAGFQRRLLIEAGDRARTARDMPEGARRSFLKAWANVIELGFSDNAAVRAAEYTKLFEACKPGDIKALPIEHALHMVASVPFGALDKLHSDDVKYLTEDIRFNLRYNESKDGGKESQIEKSVKAYVESQSAMKDVEAATKDLLTRFTDPKERAIAADILAKRAPHLTPQGLGKQFRDLASSLEVGMTQPYNNMRTGFQNAKRVTVLVTGEATAGHAMAVMLRNETGLSVDIQIVKPGMKLPDGPAILLDPMPANGPLADQIKARMGKTPQEGKILVPDALLEFHSNINLFDLAQSSLGEAEMKKVETMLRDEVAKQKGLGVDKGEITLDAAVADVMKTVDTASGRHTQLMELRGLLHFDRRNNKLAADHAAAFASVTDFVSPKEAMRLSRQLYEKLSTNIDMTRALVVVNLDKEGSSHLITHMLRKANPDLKDAQFVTIEQLRAMPAAERAKASALLYVDDCLDGGKDSRQRIATLVDVAGATPGRPRVVAAMLADFPGEVGKLEGAELVAVKEVKHFKDNVGERLPGAGDQAKLVESIGKSQWAGTKVVPLVVTFYGVPNNCPEKFVAFAHALGSAQSNKLAVDAFAKPLDMVARGLPVGKPVPNSDVVAAIDKVIREKGSSLSPVELHALTEMRAGIEGAEKPGSSAEAMMGKVRIVLGLPELPRAPDTAVSKPSVTESVQARTGAVPAYEQLPPGADKEVAEINRKVAEVFKNLRREQFEKMDAGQKQKYIDAAVEKIMPLMQQYAERLGLPKDLITKESITFDSLKNAAGLYLLESDKIVLDIGLQNPADAAFHELVHKMRALDLKAAFQADPVGARLALMDSLLSSSSARLRADKQIQYRPQFGDPKLAAEFRQQAEYHILKRLHNAGLIEAGQVPLEKAVSIDLLRHFEFSEGAMYEALANEVSNFSEAVDLVERTKLTDQSKAYVDKKAGDYKQWIENPKGTAVVRQALHEILKGAEGKGTLEQRIKAVQDKVALMTAEKKGDPKSGIQVSEPLVKQVMESYGKSDPRVEELIAADSARRFSREGAARAEFTAPPRTLRSNPYVSKLLTSATIDRAARHEGGKPEYSFASEELAARKGDVAERARRLNREIKAGQADPGAEKAFSEFVDYLKMAAEQQRLNKALAADNFEEARAIALKLQDKFAANVDGNRHAMDFLLINGLIKPEELHDSFKGFERVGGRARAIALDRFARGARTTDGIVRTEAGNGYTDHFLSKPIELFQGTERSMKVQSLRVYKDGSMTVDYIASDGRLRSDLIEHHWPGEVDPPKENEFSKDFKKVADKQPGDPVDKKLALFVDYLKQLEAQEAEIRAEGNKVKINSLLSALAEQTEPASGKPPGNESETVDREAMRKEAVKRTTDGGELRPLTRKFVPGQGIDHLFAGKGFEVVGPDGKVVMVKGVRVPSDASKGQIGYLVDGKSGLVVDAELTKHITDQLSQNETLGKALTDRGRAVDVFHRYAQTSQDLRDSFGFDSTGRLVDFRVVAREAHKAFGPTATVDGTMVRFKTECGIQMVVKFKPEEGKKLETKPLVEGELTNEKLAKLLESMKVADPDMRAALEAAMKEYLKGNDKARDFDSCREELAKRIREGNAGAVVDELKEVFKAFDVEFENGKPKLENGCVVLRPKMEGKESKEPFHVRAGGAFEKCKGKLVPIMMLVLAVAHQSQDRQESIIRNR